MGRNQDFLIFASPTVFCIIDAQQIFDKLICGIFLQFNVYIANNLERIEMITLFSKFYFYGIFSMFKLNF